MLRLHLPNSIFTEQASHFFYFLFSFATRAGSPQQREPITVGPYYLTYFPLEENSDWLQKSELIIIDDDQQDMDTKLSWSAFCQGEESSTTRRKVLSALMPLIDENKLHGNG